MISVFLGSSFVDVQAFDMLGIDILSAPLSIGVKLQEGRIKGIY
jgi:hypothetical protein